MRTHRRELVADVGLFNAHQLQPRELLRFLMQGSFAWLEAHVASYPRLVEAHGFGFVYISVELRYHARVSFADFDVLAYDTRIALKRAGTRLDIGVRFLGGGRLLAEVTSLAAIVRIEESAATSARPSALSEALQSRFLEDEKPDGPLERSMPARVAAVEDSGPALVQTRTPFTLARHQCEFADQWLFYQIPTLYEPARERSILEQGREVPLLKQGLREPLRSMAMELHRPFFAFDHGYVDSRAYDAGGRLACLHRLCSDVPSPSVHATILETF